MKKKLMAWTDQFQDDHYVFDMYGETITVDLPRKTVERLMDISLLLVDRVVAAKGEMHASEYEELESQLRKKYPKDGEWLLHLIMAAVQNDRLYGRYRDIEPMIGALMPRSYPPGTAAYLFTVRTELHKLIYAVIRHVDDAEENYESLVFTFFLGVLTKGWGEGYGWSKAERGNWVWHSEDVENH